MPSIVDHIDYDGLAAHNAQAFDLLAFGLPDGGQCAIPVHVTTGSASRPRVVAVAGIHGDEPDGMLALLEASRRISPRNLRGQLVLVPIAHPPAFGAGQRRSPIDGVDLNRAFPGAANGSPTERLAQRLFDRVVRGADFLFTLHSWYATGAVLPFVEVPDDDSEVARRSIAAARASGFERIRLTAWPAGLLVLAANAVGVPGMEAEIGDGGVSRPDNQEQYLNHLMALLRHLQMLEQSRSSIEGAAGCYRGRHIRSDFAGVLRMDVALGAAVSSGQVIANVMDLHGQTIGQMESPVAGIVVSRRSYASVAVGDLLATIFSAVDERERSH